MYTHKILIEMLRHLKVRFLDIEATRSFRCRSNLFILQDATPSSLCMQNLVSVGRIFHSTPDFQSEADRATANAIFLLRLL